MQGGAPRVVWLTLDTDPRAISVISVAQRLNEQYRPCHLVWDPVTGNLVQMLPVVRAACALGTREHVYYEPPGRARETPGVNREGRLCVQIAVLASAREPFTSCSMTGLSDILGWLDSWQIPRRWPSGQPAPFRQAEHRPRNRAKWARGGHFGASQVPDTTSIGPGGIDIDQLTGTVASGTAVGAVGTASTVSTVGPAGAVAPTAATATRPRREEAEPSPALRLDRLGRTADELSAATSLTGAR
jgi:hypothetical protein